MDKSTMKPMIKAALFTPTVKGWGMPLLFWGEPGVAKSDIIAEVCAEWGMYCLHLSPGERGEGAFGVTPVPRMVGAGDDTKMFIGYPSPDWVLEIEKYDGRACVFVDEITTAQGAAKPALLGLIQARRMAGEYLGEGVRILGAANPPEDAAEGSELPAATANRVGHIEWDAPKIGEFSSWLLNCEALEKPISKKGRAEQEEKRVLEAWGEAFSESRALVLGFLNFKTSMIHVKPNPSDPQLGRAWPSRRTWYLTSVALASARVHNLEPNERTDLIRGFVGEAAMRELLRYEHDTQLPSPMAVLDGQIKFKHDPLRLDITRAVMGSCATFVQDPKLDKREKRARMFFNLLDHIVIEHGLSDIGILAARVITRAQPLQSGKRLTDLEEARRVIKELRPTLAAIGYDV